MTLGLTFKSDLHRIMRNKHATYLDQRSFPSKVIIRTHRHTHRGSTATPGPVQWSVTSLVIHRGP